MTHTVALVRSFLSGWPPACCSWWCWQRFVVGDVFYYHRKINALFAVGLDRTLYEYPTPVVWILWLPYGASFGNRVGYLIAFVVFMLALDALFT